jgi:hypothetical protein
MKKLTFRSEQKDPEKILKKELANLIFGVYKKGNMYLLISENDITTKEFYKIKELTSEVLLWP